VISEGSCYAEDWSNDAENSGINDILKYMIKVILNRNICFW